LAKYMLLVSQLIKQGFKVEFEATKCLLNSFDSNKAFGKIV